MSIGLNNNHGSESYDFNAPRKETGKEKFARELDSELKHMVMNHRKKHGPHVSKYSFDEATKKKEPVKAPSSQNRLVKLLHKSDFSLN